MLGNAHSGAFSLLFLLDYLTHFNYFKNHKTTTFVQFLATINI